MPRLRLVSSSLACSLALTAAIALTPCVAAAQTPAADTARATELFKSGKAAFVKGDLPEAERLFSQAFALRKSSDIAANLGQSELEQQKFRSAAEHFAWALANLLPSASDAQRKAVETGLAKARAEVGVLRLEIKPAGADVLVADLPLGKAPIAGGVFVDPGEVIVSVKHEGYVALDKRVMVGKGTEQAVEVELTPKETSVAAAAPPPVDSGLGPTNVEPSPAAADRGERKSLVPAFVATGVAVAGGVVGLVFTLKASSKEDDADALSIQLGPSACYPQGGATAAECSNLQEQRDSVNSSRKLAVGAFVVGGVAAVVAGYFYWDALSQRGSKSARRERPPRALQPSFEVERGRAGDGLASVKVGLSGSF